MEAAPSAAATKAAPARSTHAAKRRRAAPSVGRGAPDASVDSSRGARRRTAATETSLAAKLAQREGEGTRTKLHKSSHVKTFLDMELHVRTHSVPPANQRDGWLAIPDDGRTPPH